MISNLPDKSGPFCVQFACPSSGYVGFLQVLWFPPSVKDMQIKSTGHSKFTIGVNVIVVGCLF